RPECEEGFWRSEPAARLETLVFASPRKPAATVRDGALSRRPAAPAAPRQPPGGLGLKAQHDEAEEPGEGAVDLLHHRPSP
ncbi:hypothetical protein ABTC93_20345, partial [Acinetobacter baumannii]